MDDSFDPYCDWLKIAGEQRPPDHYALLGLPRGEADARTIRNAAGRRTSEVMKYRLGHHAAEATRLLGEVAGALACLSDPVRKAEYDARLEPAAANGIADTPDAEEPPAAPRPIPLPRPMASERPTPRPSPATRRLVGRRERVVGLSALLVVASGLLLYGFTRQPSQPPAVAKSRSAKAAQPKLLSADRARPAEDASTTAPQPSMSKAAKAPRDEPMPRAPIPKKNLPPVVEFLTSDAEKLQAGDALAIALKGSDPDDELLVFEYRTTGSDWQPAADGRLTLRDLKVGPLVVEARARDSAGNYSDVVMRGWSVESPASPPDAVQFNNHWYKFYPEQLTWQAARDRCQAYGGRLVVIDSLEENQFVAGLIARAGRRESWVGATDEADEGTWRTVEDSLVKFTNWTEGEPDNNGGVEHYALMSNRYIVFGMNWKWNDQSNEAKFGQQPGFVCEWTTPSSGRAEGPKRAVSNGPTPTSPVKTITNSIGMRCVLIPAGEFLMGDPKVTMAMLDQKKGRFQNRRVKPDNPQHRVRITKPFYMGIYEVTVEEYAQVIREKPPFKSERLPAGAVPWGRADKFCRDLSALPPERTAGRVYRLPTEAEWEYACRAGSTTPFHFGEGKDRDSSTLDNTAMVQKRKQVGSFPPNNWGLYDMHGNVAEWCMDFYSPTFYKRSPIDDPICSMAAKERVVRGGWYFNVGQSAARGRTVPAAGWDFVGFRVVCEEHANGQ